MPGTFSPPPRVSDPEMRRGMCVTHVQWCMPGSLTSGFLFKLGAGGGTLPVFPVHAQNAILRIWLEIHKYKHDIDILMLDDVYSDAKLIPELVLPSCQLDPW